MNIYRYLAAALLGMAANVSIAQTPKGNVLIKNATVLTVTQGTLENTDVLVQDGTIKKIGTNLSAGKDMESIDASGMFLMPGIIDAHSHLALDVVNEATAPITAEVKMSDVINPFDVGIYRALAGGTTVAHGLHGSANAIGGESIVMKFRYGTSDPADIVMKEAPRTIKFALGENPTRVHGRGKNIQPRTRMGVEAVIRNGFNEALQYQKSWKDYNENKGKKNSTLTPPQFNLRLETLSDILNGELIIHCHSYRADEIYMLINVCKDFGVDKLVFTHVNEGFKVAPELAEYTMGASVFSDWWAYKFEVYYSTAYNAAILMANNVVTSINSDSDELIRHLYHEAGKTQRYGGLTDDQALSLITINPAKQLGIDEFVGSIEEGKQADLVLFNTHPLSVYAVPQMTFVDGVKYFDIKNDDDDQRLKVSPSELVEPVYLHAEHERCMHGVELFMEEGQLFNHAF